MEENSKVISLSFDDKSLNPKRFETRTIVNLTSYFRTDRLNMYMASLGYEVLPDVIRDTLKRYGYVYDYNLNGYATKTVGIANLDPRDEDSQIKANHIAMTKAKYKAYDRANRVMFAIKKIILKTYDIFDATQLELARLADDEVGAIDRVIETGYCKPM